MTKLHVCLGDTHAKQLDFYFYNFRDTSYILNINKLRITTCTLAEMIYLHVALWILKHVKMTSTRFVKTLK
jgi:hypothetical protein